MAVTALVCARVGAHLTRRLPTRTVRIVFAVLLLWGGYKYARKSYSTCCELLNGRAKPAVEAGVDETHFGAPTLSPENAMPD